jgi:hypothetical protein
MSKGLGSLQRAIIDAIRDTDRDRLFAYRGNSDICMPEKHGRGWVRVGGNVVRLAPQVADLLEVARHLAKQRAATGEIVGETKNAFRASFSRAVKSLFAAGRLTAPRMVPIAAVDPYFPLKNPDAIHDLADGMFFQQPRRKRFVTLRS